MDTDKNVISRATEEITLEARTSRMSRYKCPLLYGLIEDGNTSVVGAVMRRLDPKERKWILGIKNTKDMGVMSSEDFLLSTWIIITAVVFALLTPVFYVFHDVIVSGYRYWRVRDRRRFYPLPLFAAVASGNLDVASVLLTHGSQYTQRDDHLNNVLHHLSLVSSDDPSTTLHCYQAVREVLEGAAYRGVLEELLLGRNKDGLCPSEHCALYGNPQLCAELVNDTHVLAAHQSGSGNTGKDESCEKENPENESLLPTPSDIQRQKATDCAVITETIANRDGTNAAVMSGRFQPSVEATILHFLSTRDVQDFDPCDIQSVRNCRPLRSLVGRSLGWCWTWSGIYHLLQTAFTVIFIWEMIDSGRDNNPYPNLLQYADLYTDTMPFLATRKNFIRFLNLDCTELLRAERSCYWEAVKEYCRQTLSDMTAKCERHQTTENANITDDELYILSGAVLLHGKTSTIDDIFEKLIFFDAAGKICLILASLNLLLDIVFRIQYVLRRRSLVAVWLFKLPGSGSYTERQICMLMYVLFIAFFVYSYGYAQDVMGLVHYTESRFAVLTETIIKDQLHSKHQNLSNIVDEVWRVKLVQKINETRSAVETYVDRSSYLLVLCLVMRCVLTVYAMRLMPAIGLFVITTKRMIQHLVKFLCVFFVIQIAVACTFHYLIRARPCLPGVMEGYDTFPAAVYSTFMMAANPGTFQLRRENLTTQVFLVVFLIMMAIFLLNLITAVMTAAVMSLAQTGRRQFLCQQECWKEFIGIQTMYQMVPSFRHQYRRATVSG